MLSTDLKNWTILDNKANKIIECTNDEFKNFINKGGLKLEGKYVIVLVDGTKIKYWIDGSINN